MSNGSGGAQGAGASIAAGVGHAGGHSAPEITMGGSPTSWKRIVIAPSVSRAAVVVRLRP